MVCHLRERGYEIGKISALMVEGVGADERGECDVPLTLSKTHKLTAKDALSGLDGDCMLLISGPNNFTEALRRQLLSILGSFKAVHERNMAWLLWE